MQDIPRAELNYYRVQNFPEADLLNINKKLFLIKWTEHFFV